MDKDINTIQDILSRKNLSVDAKKRLSKDLIAISQRLDKDEYETSGIVENIFDVPDKAKQFYVHMATYAEIGKSWSRIFKKLPINNFEVVDICPGYAPKIELGLLYSDFKGKVIILDKDSRAVSSLRRFMSLFNPKFSIELCVYDLFLDQGRKFNFVVGNHTLDDLILCYFANKEGISLLDLYEKEGEFIKMWNNILINPQRNCKEITTKLTYIFTSLIEHGGYLCLSQYKSYMEKMLGLDNSFTFSKKVFDHLVKNLCLADFDRIDLLYDKTQKENNHFTDKEVVVLKKK